MHPNPAFRRTHRARNIAFARDRGFGMIAINADGGPLLSHIPFVLNEAGTEVELHLVRSNPILQSLAEPRPAVIAIQGPDSYISPDWYGVYDQVPTWNYVAVHLRGTLERLQQDALHPMLDRLSAHFEQRLAPKPAWLTSKMTPGVLQRMMRMIVPCRMLMSQIDGTWKLNQNKDDDARMSAAKYVAADGIGSELDTLATLMQSPPDA